MLRVRSAMLLLIEPEDRVIECASDSRVDAFGTTLLVGAFHFMKCGAGRVREMGLRICELHKHLHGCDLFGGSNSGTRLRPAVCQHDELKESFCALKPPTQCKVTR